MYSKTEIVERIAISQTSNLVNVKKQMIDYMVNKLLNLNDETIRKEFERASKGMKLEKIGNSYEVKFVEMNEFNILEHELKHPSDNLTRSEIRYRLLHNLDC